MKAASAVSIKASEVVANCKLPPVDCKNQCLRFELAPVSEIVSFGVAPAICRSELGVVVPMPTLLAVLKNIVEVAVKAVPPEA